MPKKMAVDDDADDHLNSHVLIVECLRRYKASSRSNLKQQTVMVKRGQQLIYVDRDASAAGSWGDVIARIVETPIHVTQIAKSGAELKCSDHSSSCSLLFSALPSTRFRGNWDVIWT